MAGGGSGLGVIFKRSIPEIVEERFQDAADAFLAKHGLTLGDIDHFACHPGGAKVVDALEGVLEAGEGALADTRATLRDYGNMSAVSVLFVLRRMMDRGLSGRYLMTALGPGFTAASRCWRHRGLEFGPAHWIILAVAAQRLSELVIARRNTASLLAKGAVEHFPGHYPFFIGTAWQLACCSDRRRRPGYRSQLGGHRHIRRSPARPSLGAWNAGGEVDDAHSNRSGQPPIRHGPFRWVRHPNYLVVALEIPCLPLAFGLWPVAALWGALNLLLLNHRIRREDSAWASR